MLHIIGANGFIGTKFRDYIAKSIDHFCYDTNLQERTLPIDLTNPEQFDFSRIKSGDFVLFLAAISRPDICKNQRDFAWSINVDGTEKFIRKFSEQGAHVLFFSSDVVYGPTTTEKVNELSSCAPYGPYAEMKREIEKRFADDLNVKVFRLSYVFSKEDRFTAYLAECARENKTAEVFDSLYRSVVYINDIFDGVIALSDKFTEFDNQIFNLSGPEVLSRKDMTQIFKHSIESDLEYVTVDPPEGFFEARPPVIATESLYLETLLGRKPTSIQEAMIREFANK